MPYKVNADGSIETSSAQEALELQRLIQERVEKSQQRQARSQQTLFARANGHESENVIVKKLLELRGTEINSGQMMGIIGAKTAAGVGPKLYHLKKSIPAIEDILETQKDERGIVTWTVRQ